MRKTSLTIIVYVLGLIFGALLLGLWDAETNLAKAGMGFVWTIIFLITLFYFDKNEKK